MIIVVGSGVQMSWMSRCVLGWTGGDGMERIWPIFKYSITTSNEHGDLTPAASISPRLFSHHPTSGSRHSANMSVGRRTSSGHDIVGSPQSSPVLAERAAPDSSGVALRLMSPSERFLGHLEDFGR